jgi:hypothetical protein
MSKPAAKRKQLRLQVINNWLAVVSRYQSAPMAIPPSQIVRSLRLLAQIKVLSNSRGSVLPAVVAAVTALTHAAITDNSVRKATVLGRLADAVAAHPDLAKALAEDPEASRSISELLSASAAAPATFEQAAAITQVATAQVRLRRGCPPFWEYLHSTHVCMHGDARLAATLLFTRLKLARLRLLPFPEAHAWDTLLRSACARASTGGPRFVSNCLLALAYAAEAPDLEADASTVSVLLGAAQQAAPDMNAQEVANTLWALSVLHVPLSTPTYAALVDAVTRTAPEMNAQNVANTSLAFGRLGTFFHGPAGAALMLQMAAVAGRWNAQEVANTLWALRTVKGCLPEPVCEALLASLERTALQLSVEELRFVLEGLVTLRESFTATRGVRARLLCATRRLAATSDHFHSSRIICTLIELGWKIPRALGALRPAAVHEEMAVS